MTVSRSGGRRSDGVRTDREYCRPGCRKREGLCGGRSPDSEPAYGRPDMVRTSVPGASDVSRTDRILPIALLCTAVVTAGLHPCHARQQTPRRGLESLLDEPVPAARPEPAAERPRAPAPAAWTTEPARKLPRPDEAAVRAVRDLVYELAGEKNRDLAVDVLIYATGVAEFDVTSLRGYAARHGLTAEGFRKQVLAMQRRLGLPPRPMQQSDAN